MKTRMLLIALLVLSLSLFAWASAEEPAGETDAAPAEEAGAAPEEAADPAADAESEAEAEPAPPEPAELAGEWVCTLDLGFWTETAALTLNEDMTCTLVTGNPDRVTESLEGTWSLAGNVLSLNGTEVGTVALSGHTLTVAQAGGENVLTFSRAEIQVLTADDVVGAWEILSDTDPDSTLVFAADGSCVYTEFSAEFPTTWSLEDGVFTFNNQTVRAEMNGENLILSNETTRTVLRRIELPAASP